jgi:hypothetical protein
MKSFDDWKKYLEKGWCNDRGYCKSAKQCHNNSKLIAIRNNTKYFLIVLNAKRHSTLIAFELFDFVCVFKLK